MSHVHRGGRDPVSVTILRIIIIDHELHHPREFGNLSAFPSVNLPEYSFYSELISLIIIIGERDGFDGSSGSGSSIHFCSFNFSSERNVE